MSQNDSGIGGYPAYVKAAFMIMLDPPSKVEVRVDPESKQKAEEERQRNEQAEERLRQSSFPPGLNRRSPPLVTLYLQWLDATYPEQPVWRDVRMNIDVEKRRFRNNAAGIPFLSRGRQGSGALGVVLVSIPFLLLASPYIVWRSRRDSAREAQAGMSRHASALLEKLRG